MGKVSGVSEIRNQEDNLNKMSYGGGDPRCAQMGGYGGGGGYGYNQQYGSNYGGGYGDGQPYNAPSWGYIILYLVIISIGIIGNLIFCFIIKKCPALHRTHHFFFLAVSVMDIFVCTLAIPFVIDSQAKITHWNLPEFLCKFYLFVDFGLKGVHAFLLVFGALFLYFWYRKNESYSTETGDITTRRTRMHKWAIPLAWVVGLGIAVPAGAMATMTCGRCSVFHFGRTNTDGSEFYINLAFLVVAFVLPWVILMFPLLALFMQICGARSPRLDPPHSRTAMLMVLFILLFIASRAPHDIYELMKMFSMQYGIRADNMNRGMPQMAIETEMTLNCLVYVPCMIHPILFILINGEYRQGFRDMWRNLYCNKNQAQRDAQVSIHKQSKYKNPPPIIRQNPGGRRGGGYRKSKENQLVAEVQPMIMPAQQPLVNQMTKQMGNPYIGQQYIQGNQRTPYIPMQPLNPQQEPFLDHSTSFEMDSPTGGDPTHQFPAVFEYGKFKYIDSARVEPKIAYTPTNTPPKTPQIIHYDIKPFKQPNYVDGTWSYPVEQEAYTGIMPASQIPIGGFPQQDPNLPSSATPVEVDDIEFEKSPDPIEIESLENSPGSTLRSSRRGHPEVKQLTASPGPRRRVDGVKLEDAPARTNSTPNKLDSALPRTNPKHQDNTNGHTNGHTRPSSPEDRSQSRQSTVEITLSGRSRSRQDLCPDRPRSRFEHAV